MSKKWIRIVVVILILLLSFRLWQKFSSGNQEKGLKNKRNQTVSVEIDSVTIQDIQASSNFSGSLFSADQVFISAQINGTLKKSLVDIGDKVKKGQTLALIDDSRYAVELEKAKAAYQIALANAEQTKDALSVSEKELKHNKQLFQDNYISQTEFDSFNSKYIADKSKNEIALANVSSTKAALKSAQLDYNDCRITADWAQNDPYRLVAENNTQDGSLISKGSTLFSLVNLNKMKASFTVSEDDYNKIKTGQSAEIIIDSYPDKSFQGTVKRIAPVLNQLSRQATVEIEIDNSSNLLKPGMFCKITLTFEKKTAVPVVPLSALYEFKGEKGVFMLTHDKEKVNFIKISTGLKNDKYIEIVSQDISGYVVTIGQDLLEDGSNISLPQSSSNKDRKHKKK